MPIPRYSVLKGKVTGSTFIENHGHDHFIINIQVSENQYKAFVNVLSYDGSNLEYLHNSNWTDPFKNKLAELEPGSHELQRQPDGMALDYIRSNIVDITAFTNIQQGISRSESDLTNLLKDHVERAQSNDDSVVYVFGSAFKDNNETDLGIHDVHMNQGNPESGGFEKDNGVYQDGALFFQFSNDEWVALFLKFRTQAINTDDQTGNSI
ncbi:MAG TPA: YukJ family protein [Candidatus Nitrosocosmicus sp.]